MGAKSIPNLYDLLITAGGQDVIPDDLCSAAGIGKDRVWAVLTDRCLMANENTGLIWWSTAELGKRLGLNRSRIRYADQVLIAAGLMQDTGQKKSRTKVYRMIPGLLAARDVAGEVAGEVAGDMAGIPATNRTEQNIKSSHVPNWPSPEPTRAPMTDLTSQMRQDVADVTSEVQEAREWLVRFTECSGIEMAATTQAIAAAVHCIQSGIPAHTAPGRLQDAGHNLDLIRGGATIKGLLDLAPTRSVQILVTEPWRQALPDQCPHPENVAGLLPNQCGRCRAAAGAAPTMVAS